MFAIPIGFYLAWLTFYVIFVLVICGKYIKRNKLVTMTHNFETKFWFSVTTKFQKTSVIKMIGWQTPEKHYDAFLIVFTIGHIVYNVASVVLSLLNFRFFYCMLVINSFWITRSFYNGANYYMTRFSAHYEKQLAQL